MTIDLDQIPQIWIWEKGDIEQVRTPGSSSNWCSSLPFHLCDRRGIAGYKHLVGRVLAHPGGL